MLILTMVRAICVKTARTEGSLSDDVQDEELGGAPDEDEDNDRREESS